MDPIKREGYLIIQKKIEEIQELIKECENIAKEAEIDFVLDLGNGRTTYYADTDEWISSSSNC